MKIISFNVNGIRAIMKKGFMDYVTKVKPDVLCLQETKADLDKIPDEIKNVEGYHTFWHSCERKSGYSGVGILSRIKPDNGRNMTAGEFVRGHHIAPDARFG